MNFHIFTEFWPFSTIFPSSIKKYSGHTTRPPAYKASAIDGLNFEVSSACCFCHVNGRQRLKFLSIRKSVRFFYPNWRTKRSTVGLTPQEFNSSQIHNCLLLIPVVFKTFLGRGPFRYRVSHIEMRYFSCKKKLENEQLFVTICSYIQEK